MSEKCKKYAKEYNSYLDKTFTKFQELQTLGDISGATPETVLALVNQSLLMLKTQELLLEILLSIDEIGDKINAMEDSLEKQEPTKEEKTEDEE